ncbi:hypothetical protein TgHK011_005351 [Trichoderma gracile]|nr:hypothetical protein TgHK011_005351 [Trichoderma gracile]
MPGPVGLMPRPDPNEFRSASASVSADSLLSLVMQQNIINHQNGVAQPPSSTHTPNVTSLDKGPGQSLLFVSCSLALLPLRPNLVAVTDTTPKRKQRSLSLIRRHPAQPQSC